MGVFWIKRGWIGNFVVQKFCKNKKVCNNMSIKKTKGEIFATTQIGGSIFRPKITNKENKV